jgi:ring-1,2-phenylacetyl-CoA epoxidase subunit PaaD
MVRTVTLEERARDSLAEVMDPEIPAVSIVDLGMVERIEASDEALEVDLLPTFVGCPAIDVIREDARAALREVAEERDVRVRMVFDPPWTTDRITDRGREGLRSYGISPHWEGGPPKLDGPVPVSLLRVSNVECPYCGSRETVQDTPWGPTPCRAVHYCRSCRNPFEGFKERPRASAS